MAKGQGGRPLKYKSKAELENKINAYFESCFAPAVDKNGSMIKDPRTGELMLQQIKPFTVAGLAYYLGVTRATLINYGKDERFFDTVKKAKARIEAYAEEQLFANKATAGVIFNLKNNFGWKDKQDVKLEQAEDRVAEAIVDVFGFRENAE